METIRKMNKSWLRSIDGRSRQLSWSKKNFLRNAYNTTFELGHKELKGNIVGMGKSCCFPSATVTTCGLLGCVRLNDQGQALAKVCAQWIDGRTGRLTVVYTIFITSNLAQGCLAFFTTLFLFSASSSSSLSLSFPFSFYHSRPCKRKRIKCILQSKYHNFAFQQDIQKIIIGIIYVLRI